MTDLAIRVESLSKLYRIGPREPYKALRDPLTDAMYGPFRAFRSLLSGRRSPVVGPPSALRGLRSTVVRRLAVLGPPSSVVGQRSSVLRKDVSFEVKQGEVVGITRPPLSVARASRSLPHEAGRPERSGKATLVKPGQKMLDLNKEIRERRTLRGYHRVP